MLHNHGGTREYHLHTHTECTLSICAQVPIPTKFELTKILGVELLRFGPQSSPDTGDDSRRNRNSCRSNAVPSMDGQMGLILQDFESTELGTHSQCQVNIHTLYRSTSMVLRIQIIQVIFHEGGVSFCSIR